MPADAAADVEGEAASDDFPKSSTAFVAFSWDAKASCTTVPAVETTPFEKSVIELTIPFAKSATSGENEMFCCALSCKTTAPLSAPTRLSDVLVDWLVSLEDDPLPIPLNPC